MLSIIIILATLGSSFGREIEIVNGEEATPHEFPFIVGLRIWGQHFCGGAILNENWVLSAAHCVDETITMSTVMAGDHDNSKSEGTEQERTIDFSDIHSLYNYTGSIDFDFALLRVSKPFDFSGPNVKPISFPSYGWDPKTNSATAIAMGWGSTKNLKKGPMPSKLQKFTVNLLTDKECSKYGFPLTSEKMCIMQKGKSACAGDSGGPLACKGDDGNYIHCGVASYVAGDEEDNCNTEAPNVYARTSEVDDWINSYIN